MGYGSLSFTPMKTNVYKFQTSKPWNEIKDKNIVWKTHTEYGVLEEQEGAPVFFYETGRRCMFDLIERFNVNNQDKDLWNPWRWECMYFSESSQTLTPENVKKLYAMWDDLWEYVDENEKEEKEIRKEEKRQKKERARWEKERLKELDKSIEYTYFSVGQKAEEVSECYSQSETSSESEKEEHLSLDKIIYKGVKPILEYAIENNCTIFVHTVCD
jgi:hypothetical protein